MRIVASLLLIGLLACDCQKPAVTTSNNATAKEVGGQASGRAMPSIGPVATDRRATASDLIAAIEAHDDKAVGRIMGSIYQRSAATDELLREYSRQLAERLLPESVWNSCGFPMQRRPRSVGGIVDYGDRGRIVSIQKKYGPQPYTDRLVVSIDNPAGIDVRRKLALYPILKRGAPKWRIGSIDGESDYWSAFFFQYHDGGCCAYVCMEGVLVKISIGGDSLRGRMRSAERLVKSVLKRLRSLHKHWILSLSNSKLFANNPNIERPDIPSVR